MKKAILAATFAVMLSVSGYTFAADDAPYKVVEKFPFKAGVQDALQLLDSDRFVGKEDAPIQVIEYASMTCGHCAAFEKSTYPQIKENYIDTGKVRFVMRPMPWDNRALAVSLIAMCAPRDQYENFVSAFFSTQTQWATSKTFLEDVKKIARLGGMDGDMVEKCVADPDLRKVVDAGIEMGTKTLEVQATPTFFINGEKVEGALPYAELANYLDEMLKKIEAK